MTDRKDIIDNHADKLKEWDERIIEAEKNLAEIKDDIKENAKKEIDNLKMQLKDAKEKLKGDNSKKEDLFNEINKGLEKHWSHLKGTMKSVYVPMQ